MSHHREEQLDLVPEKVSSWSILRAGPWTVPSSRMYGIMMCVMQMPLFALLSLSIGDFEVFKRIVTQPMKCIHILGVMYLPALHGAKSVSRQERMRRVAKTLRNCWDMPAERCYRIPAFLNYMRRLDTHVLNLFNDKEAFNKFCTQAGVPCAVAVDLKSDFKLPKCDFIVKPSGGAFGAEVRLYKWSGASLCNALTDEMLDEAKVVAELKEKAGDFVCEERLMNHSSIVDLIGESAKALCTFRVMTVTDSADLSKVVPLTAVLRLVVATNTAADNGAIFVSADWESNTLAGPGMNGFGEKFETHPLSGKTIKGHPLDVKLAVQTAMDWHKRFALEFFKTPLRIMGWDIALTTNGPKIIELNEVGHPAFQVATGPWLDNSVARKIFDSTGGSSDWFQKNF